MKRMWMKVEAYLTAANVAAALLVLAPYLAAAFWTEALGARVRAAPAWLRLGLPVLLGLPYLLVAIPGGTFQWRWLGLYAALPVGVALLLDPATRKGANRGGWREFLLLAVLGLAVDLRWFEAAWPAHMAVFNKMVLLDAGIYGFVLVEDLEGAGFNLRLRWRDVLTGLRELVLYVPLALALGMGLGFLHPHAAWPGPALMAGAWVFTFFFIAVPEELFFRGWLQNLLERRMGRTPALLVSSVLFGLAHFNKHTAFFNWRYVLLAAIAGVFYGRAWRRDRRVGASAVTHASVDTLWSLWLK